MNKKRIIITTDVGNEIDDQFAVIHFLLSDCFKIEGIVPTFFNEKNSIEIATQKLNEISRLLNKKISVQQGSYEKFDSNPVASPGSKLIEQKSLEDNTSKLYVAVIGGLTDVAIALKNNPKIKDKLIIIWVGGGRYPHGSREANFDRDRAAANYVLQSGCELWQIPSGAYKQMRVSTAYLQYVLSNNKIGDYLLDELHSFISKNIDIKSWINPEIWVLGDSSAVSVLLEEQKGSYSYNEAPQILDNGTYKYNNSDSKIRVYQTVDRTMTIQDFIAKIKQY